MSHAGQIYPAKYFCASATYDHWVKLSIANVHRLRRVDGFEGQNISFWLNHPVRFVYVVGSVVGISEICARHESNQSLVILNLDDGSGACIEAKFLHNRDGPTTSVSNVTVDAGIGKFEVRLDGQVLEIGSVVKAKGTLAQFRGQKQLDLKRIAVVRDTNDEAAAWRMTAEFLRDVLSHPWLLDETKRRSVDEKIEASARKQRKLVAHRALKQQRRTTHESKLTERRRDREKRRRLEEAEMNSGAIVYSKPNLTSCDQHSPWRGQYATNPPRAKDYPPEASDRVQESSYARPAHDLSQAVTRDEKEHYRNVEHHRKQQILSPWTRAGSDRPPVADEPSPLIKGKLLTTPSRMLKLILPLTTQGKGKIEPLALLVHPQQPLSYLERLVQSECAPVRDETGRDKIPSVTFRALDTGDSPDASDGLGKVMVDGKVERTGKVKSPEDRQDHNDFVRWSPSTEIGDFIRDASHGKEFSVDIEGTPPIYVSVPTFADRTYYLRMRLRKTLRRISDLANLKRECDTLAHKSAKRVAQAGFGGLVAWWYTVYRLTFETELGWDVMEPVTYLVGLSTLIGGYMWFLFHNREVSYRSAMDVTISRRQSKLYAQRGFNLPLWEGLTEEGNRLRREIKLIADEYDVEWDEREEADEKVAEALREEREKAEKAKAKDKEDQ